MRRERAAQGARLLAPRLKVRSKDPHKLAGRLGPQHLSPAPHETDGVFGAEWVGGTSLLRADDDRIQGREASIAPTAAACTPTPDAADGVPTSPRPGGCGGVFVDVVTAAATGLKPVPVRPPRALSLSLSLSSVGVASRPVHNAVGCQCAHVHTRLWVFG